MFRLLVASMGSGENPGSVANDWLAGVFMYFAGHAMEKNEQLVEEASLRIVDARPGTINEKRRSVTFLRVVARICTATVLATLSRCVP